MKSSGTLAALAATASVCLASPLGRGVWHRPSGGHGDADVSGWDLQNFESLVIFGDSYSDDSRIRYFQLNGGEAPPVGWLNPVNWFSATGGRVWGQYVLQYSSATNLYNYAVSGAVCSNEITPRWYEFIGTLWPSVAEYELPAYLADSAYVQPDGQEFLDDDAESTVFAMWIGTNDLGTGAFLDDAQVAGTNLTTYVDCVYDQLTRLYDNGGRYFVLFNNAPLHLAPAYMTPSDDVPGNTTQLQQRMLEQVVTVNEIFEYRTPFEVVLAGRYPGAKIAVFDVNALMTDIHDNPAEYLNGTAPLNVDGFAYRCNATGGDCAADPSPDSFLWYDPLHPGEQTERVIAREFVNVVEGGSPWAMYWSD